MQITGNRKINAKRSTVFAALNDVKILQEAIPGCDEVSKESYNEFTGSVVAKVGPIKSKFVGRASLENVLPPESYTIVGEGKGGPAGNVKVTAKVELLEEESETVISYEVDAKITGKLAQLGGPIVRKATEKLSEQFFSNLQEILAKNPNAINEPGEVESPDKTGNKRLLAIALLAILSYVAYLIF
ncbi:MAG: carbon monoxide dehydrogenase subunit G [Pseudomonadota bacterium]|nr:carbon monoxide dehydrogenase subunit G [Pseudomonadota bacterium]